MSGFSVDWLDLREAADRRARDKSLLAQARQWLRSQDEDKRPEEQAGGEESAGDGDASVKGNQDSRPIVVDLGAGTGSTLRAFAAASEAESVSAGSGASPSWRLVDQDSELLAAARARHGDRHAIEICARDLTDLAGLPLTGARLVTASALFDLVSADFIDALARLLQRLTADRAIGLYAALSYDGSTSWTPSHPLDGQVLDAINCDQKRDKGFGPALGPEAGAYLENALSGAGFVVRSASTPWLLDGGDSELLAEFIRGIGRSAAADPALDESAVEDWLRFRLEHVTTGTCSVGHRDCLALPPGIERPESDT